MKPIWFKPVDVKDLAKYSIDTMMGHLDMEIIEVGPDFVRARMPVNSHVHQVFGSLHGGASVALAETVGSLACMLTLDLEKQFCVGQEINANHLRGIRSGYVTATARPFYIGGTSQVWGIEIAGDDGKLVCISRLTMAVRNGKP